MAEQAEILALLKRAQSGAIHGDVETYDVCMAQAKRQIEALGSPEKLLGEWVFVSRLDCLLDIDRLLETLERAALLIGGRAQTEDGIPLNDGSDSTLMGFLGQPGQADANREKMRRIVALYASLTGTGYGFETLYDAELSYYRGELDRAAVLAHQAVFTARNTGQDALLICAAKVLACIAKHRLDAEGWKYAFGIVGDAVSRAGDNSVCASLAMTIRIELLVQLDDYGTLPEWFCAGSFGMVPGKGLRGFRFRSMNPSVNYSNQPLLLWSYTLYLFSSGQRERMRAMLELQRTFGISQTVPAYDIFYSQLAGLDALWNGDTAAAEEAFNHAIDIVAPDGLWLCIAKFSPLSKGFMQELIAKRDVQNYPYANGEYEDFVDQVAMLREAVRTGVDMLGSLTAREREVARLVAQGMRNGEIAQLLNVTEQTIKFHLSNVYAKLSVNGRSRLAALINDIMK